MLSRYTGVNLKPRKQEIETFFDPIDTKEEERLVNFDSNDVRDRYISSVGHNRSGERPFEPEQVGPGIGLAANKQTIGNGLHSNARVMPKQTNELRALNKQKETYTEPVLPGQYGHIAPFATTYGEVRKYGPAKFKEYEPGEHEIASMPTGGIYATQHYILKDTERTNANREELGPANLTKLVSYNINLAGVVRDPNKEQLGTFNVQPGYGAVKRNGQGKDTSYTQYENQRDTTNYEYFSAAGNQAVGGNVVLPEDNARPTIRQDTSTQLNTFTGTGVHSYYNNNQNDAKPTIRQATSTQLNTFTGTGEHGYYNNNQNDARPTIRQDTSTQLNTFTGTGEHGYYNNNQNDARPTIRQDTSTQLNTFTGTGEHGYYNNNQNDARPTIRQDTSTHLNTNVKIGGGTYVLEPFDEAKPTIRQDTSTQLNTFTGTGIHSYYNNNQNDARPTIRQDTSTQLNTNLTGDSKGYKLDSFDEAKPTIKQTTLITDYINALGSSADKRNAVYQTDEVKPTIKQSTLIDDYVGVSHLVLIVSNRVWI